MNPQNLISSLRGPVVLPGSEQYNESRKLYNAMIDKKPAVIARCKDVADVVAAVRFGKENGLDIAVRGGGHNGGGLGSVDDGLMIDLSLMRGIRVDPLARTAQVEGGCSLTAKRIMPTRLLEKRSCHSELRMKHESLALIS